MTTPINVASPVTGNEVAGFLVGRGSIGTPSSQGPSRLSTALSDAELLSLLQNVGLLSPTDRLPDEIPMATPIAKSRDSTVSPLASFRKVDSDKDASSDEESFPIVPSSPTRNGVHPLSPIRRQPTDS